VGVIALTTVRAVQARTELGGLDAYLFAESEGATSGKTQTLSEIADLEINKKAAEMAEANKALAEQA
jgi:hypothetical protein